MEFNSYITFNDTCIVQTSFQILITFYGTSASRLINQFTIILSQLGHVDEAFTLY